MIPFKGYAPKSLICKTPGFMRNAGDVGAIAERCWVVFITRIEGLRIANGIWQRYTRGPLAACKKDIHYVVVDKNE